MQVTNVVKNTSMRNNTHSSAMGFLCLFLVHLLFMPEDLKSVNVVNPQQNTRHTHLTIKLVL